MQVEIKPSVLSGSVALPPSKSAAHRSLICGALAKEESKITPFCNAEDVVATLNALKKLGAVIEDTREGYSIRRGDPLQPCKLDFCESGATARFIMPIAAALGIEATFVGGGRLPERPMKTLCRLMREHGVCVSSDSLPIEIKGKMQAGVFRLPGDVSSQFVSGIMLAAPLMEGETVIELTAPLRSVGYVDMTIETMKKFGVEVGRIENGFRVLGGQSYKPYNARIEGDWSAAAFFMAAAAIGGDIEISNLNFASSHADMAALDVFAAFGADITLKNDTLHIKKGDLHGIEVNAENIPDMVPAIAVTAAFANGKTVIRSTERLRLKESDRVKAIVDGLRALGVKAEAGYDIIEIEGGRVTGGKINGAADHRIVMAFSIAAAFAKGESIITDCRAIGKSYPDFFEDFKRLGGKAE